MNKLLRGRELIERAEQLGVYIYAHHEQIPLGTKPIMAAIASENVIQNRVMIAEKHINDQRLWWFSFGSAIASVLSALAAWFAVILR